MHLVQPAFDYTCFESLLLCIFHIVSEILYIYLWWHSKCSVIPSLINITTSIIVEYTILLLVQMLQTLTRLPPLTQVQYSCERKDTCPHTPNLYIMCYNYDTIPICLAPAAQHGFLLPRIGSDCELSKIIQYKCHTVHK